MSLTFFFFKAQVLLVYLIQNTYQTLFCQLAFYNNYQAG